MCMWKFGIEADGIAIRIGIEIGRLDGWILCDDTRGLRSMT